MIITEHLKENFFDEINGKHLLIIVASGVDSVCSFKIIKHILKNYGSPFSYDVIRTKSELKSVFSKYGQVDNLLLINYGAVIDILEFLEIDQDSKMIVYILDSQRPIHINNFYNNTQVKLLAFEESFESVPDFDDIYRDSDDETDSENDDESPPKRSRPTKQYLENKIKLREWKKQREDIMSIYTDYIYHGTASSLVAYEIAASVNQFNNELLWTAAIGHTSQYVLNFSSRKKYCEHLDSIKNNLARVTLSRTYTKMRNKEELFMEAKEELNLWLYRHWSLNESLHVSPVTLTTFKLCKIRGMNKLNEFLAYLGIPQQECKDPFQAMRTDIKSIVFPMFKEHCEKFQLPKEELFLPAFIVNCGYRTSLSTIDATFIVAAILEDINSQDDDAERFTKAMEVLSVLDNEKIEWGLKLAKDFLKLIHQQTKDLMEANNVVAYGSFLHVELNKASPPLLRSTLIQYILARYVLNASFSIRPKLGVSKKADRSPLIFCSEPIDDKIVLYGIPPLVADPGKNLFGRVFETVLSNLNYQLEQDHLDVCRITINWCDKMKIFDRISRLLMS